MNSHAVGIDLGARTSRLPSSTRSRSPIHPPCTGRRRACSGPAGSHRLSRRRISGRARRAPDQRRCRRGGPGRSRHRDRAVGAHLRWRNVALRELPERALSVPVKIMNDVHAAAYGEWRYGAGRTATISSASSSETVSRWRYRRRSFPAGRQWQRRRARPCHRRPRRTDMHLRQSRMPGGFRRRMGDRKSRRQRLNVEPAAGGWLRRLCNGDLGTITAETVGEACRHGDPLALSFMQGAGRALGAGIAGMINGFNPARVILGGGVLEGMRTAAPRRARSADACPQCALRDLSIVKAALGPSAARSEPPPSARSSAAHAPPDPALRLFCDHLRHFAVWRLPERTTGGRIVTYLWRVPVGAPHLDRNRWHRHVGCCGVTHLKIWQSAVARRRSFVAGNIGTVARRFPATLLLGQLGGLR